MLTKIATVEQIGNDKTNCYFRTQIDHSAANVATSVSSSTLPATILKGLNSYQAPSTQSRPWDEIEKQFTEDLQSRPVLNILNLVKHIRSSGLSKRLYAVTSHDKLVISIYDSIEWNKESLHVQFHHEEQKWSFQYFAKPFSDPEFVRQYNEHLGIEKFDNFIKMINW